MQTDMKYWATQLLFKIPVSAYSENYIQEDERRMKQRKKSGTEGSVMMLALLSL